MICLGTALCPSATRVMLLGSGELGKEIAIECQRLGIEVIALDCYAAAPAMHVAHHSHIINMLDGDALSNLIIREKPDFIVPEIEFIATDTLITLEANGQKIVPCARAVKLTTNREQIRRLVAEKLAIPTSKYCFAYSKKTFIDAVEKIGYPCIVKPIISFSGRGHNIIQHGDTLDQIWECIQHNSYTKIRNVIVEKVVKFDFEITLLTVHAVDGIYFCNPIGHRQQNGNYQESWQPQQINKRTLLRAQEIARKVVIALGGYGLFGVELFICNDDVIFNEVSSRPHDTGILTLISQNLSQFALHVRAFLGFPIGEIIQYVPAASVAILPKLSSSNIMYENVNLAIKQGLQLLLFGKPTINGTRRLGVALATGDNIIQALDKAKTAVNTLSVKGR